MTMEQEIRDLLLDLREPEIVAQQLLRKYEILDCSLIDMESLGAFFLRAGCSWMFCELCVKKLDMNGALPWGHFGQALFQATAQIPVQVRKALVTGSAQQKLMHDFARTHAFDHEEAEQLRFRNDRRQQQQNRYRNFKRELLNQLEMFRSQELEQEEERVVQLLMDMFPHDQEIDALNKDVHERKAVRLLEKKLQDHDGAPWERADQPLLEPAEREQLDIIVASMKRILKKNPKNAMLAHDFAIALLMWDYPEASLDFLSENDRSPRVLWTRFEALLHSRQFVNLLNEIDQCEMNGSGDPDATFALQYLKGLSLWGLGHRFAALEILENIVAHRPHYRSAMTLLRLWKGGAA